MGLAYEDLDVETRRIMIEELEADYQAKKIYFSNYLNDSGNLLWVKILREAIEVGSDDSLADQLDSNACFKQKTERRKPNGGVSLVSVPVTAAHTLAESQFNMYFMRAISRRALSENCSLLVYRAKSVANPRSQSEMMIGTSPNPAEVLEVLRNTIGVEPPIGIPLPNSGITIKLVKK